MRSLPLLTLLCVAFAPALAQDVTLYSLAREGDNATLERMLAAGADPNVADDDGWTPLMLAAMNGNLGGARALLAAGADPNFGEADQGPPLAVAAMTPVVPPSDENAILRLMLDKGAIVDIPNGAGMTPLMYAAREGNAARAAFLMQRGADVNHRDAREWTPLRFASSSGSPQLVRLLLAHGALPNVLDESFRTPLHYAVAARHVDVARALLDAGADPNLTVVEGGYPTPLMLAAHAGDTASIRLLLERNARPNYSDLGAMGDDGVARTPLDWVRVHGSKGAEKLIAKAGGVGNADLMRAYADALKAVRKGDDRALARLVGTRVDPRVPVRTGDAELFLLDEAASLGRPAVVKALLARNFAHGAHALYSALVRARAAKHLQVLPTIVAAAPGPLAMLAVVEGDDELFDAAVSASSTALAYRDDDGRTLLHAAAASGSDDRILFLLERGADVNARASWKETPLFEAARVANPATIELLVRHRADVAARNVRGMTPLHAAARMGLAENVELLVAAGADIDVADDDGWRPLHQAAWADSDATVEALLRLGARRDAADKAKRTAIDIARQMNNADAARVLAQ